MILTCPECSTSFIAKDDAIGPNGRTVRCTKCSATWFVPASDVPKPTPDELQLADIQKSSDDIVPEVSAPIQDEKVSVPTPIGTQKSADVLMRDKADAAKKRARRRSIWLIWLIPILLILAILACFYFGRHVITDRFPGTVPIYNAVGVKISQSGLEIESPTLRMVVVNGETTVVINGAIKNISNTSQSLPMMRLSLHNPAGEELVYWLVDSKKPLLNGN